MYSRSTTVRTTTNRGRGRGRGRQTRHDFTFSHPTTIPDEDMDENYTYSERRMGSSMFSHNRGNNQSSNRRHSNFRANENGNDRSTTVNNSSNTNSKPSKIPEHAKNPFFIGELMSRFNNMLPSSIFVEDEKDESTQQPEVLSNPNRDSDGPSQTFDSTINRRVSGSNSNFNCKENSPFYDHNKNNEKTMKRNTNDEENSCNRYTIKNKNSGNNHLNRTSEGLPQTNFKRREPNSSQKFIPDSSRKAENLRVNNSVNRPNSSANNNHSNNSELEIPSNVPLRKISTTSNKSDNDPITLKNISLEERKEIMKQCGFDFKPLDQNSSDNSEGKTVDNNVLDIPQSFPHGLIASRTSPRIRFNLENDTTQNMLPSNTSYQIENDNSKLKFDNHSPQNSSILDKCLPEEKCDDTHLEQISSDKAKPNIKNVKLSNCSSGKPSEENLANNVVKDENTPQQPGLSDVFFAQLDAFKKSSNDPGNKKSLRPLKNNMSARKNSQNFNPSLKSETPTPQDNPGLFLPSNTPRLIERSVAGRNPLNVHRPARDANERVPSRAEALESLQEQYEIQRAVHEQKKKEKEAKKREEYLARYKHVDQGYRLNEGLLDEAAGYAPGFNPFETEEEVRQRQQEQLRQESLAYQERMREKEEKQKIKEKSKIQERLQKYKHCDAGYRLGSGDRKTSTSYPGPELLLKGETEEEAIRRQEEQLLIETLIQSQVELQEQNSQGAAPTQVTNAAVPLSKQHASSVLYDQGAAPTQVTNAAVPLSKQHARSVLYDQAASPTQGTSAPMLLNKQPARSVLYDQAAAPTQGTSAPMLLNKQPSSCAIKSRNGAVLILRPTAEELNQALARKFEVQDDFDKKGYSLHYTPQTEQASLYSNNRFERKPYLDTVKPTGAIPKNSAVSAVKPASLVTTNDSVVNNETPKQEEPPIDHNAEMRAARLRLQQQYEESLKKKQEQRNEP